MLTNEELFNGTVDCADEVIKQLKESEVNDD